MGIDRRDSMERVPLRRLSKHDIDRHVEFVVAEVAVGCERAPGSSDDAGAALRPRWISAAELVRRMRRFLVYN
jgi:hypothetical protein